MTILTRPLSSTRTRNRYHAVVQAALAVTFWGIAALVVAIAHQRLTTATPVACTVVEVGAIVALAGAYIRIAAPTATLDHALLTGTAWLLLGIATEIVMRMTSGHQWFALLGSPEQGGLRSVLLIAWIIAPALFVSSGE